MAYKTDFKIVFMGTPEFAAESLKALHEAKYCISAVITAPDKPAGRGKKVKKSAVKEYALLHNLNILQPTNLKDPKFISDIKALQADLQIVVAFRMLPEIVWSMPKFGTVNLHASLLPQYRGAAPINHAIMNGETKTGVTTFFIEKEIDTGKIIMQEEVDILPDENAGQLHDKLMDTGSKLILKTTETIINGTVTEIPQSQLIHVKTELKPAPKIFKENCRINWTDSTETVRNFIRGLSPYPGAWTLISDNKENIKTLKIFDSRKTNALIKQIPGIIQTDNKQYLKISCSNGTLEIFELQIEGKRKMPVRELLNGFSFQGYKIVT